MNNIRKIYYVPKTVAQKVPNGATLIRLLDRLELYEKFAPMMLNEEQKSSLTMLEMQQASEQARKHLDEYEV